MEYLVIDGYNVINQWTQNVSERTKARNTSRIEGG